MLLTFIIDPPFLLFLGYLFACAVPLTVTGDPLKSRAFWAGITTITVFNIAVGLSYWWFPDWMWMYLLHASEWTPPVKVISLALALLVYYLLYRLGFQAGVRLRREGRSIRWYLILCGVLSIVVVVPVAQQYFHVGTYREYLIGAAQPLPQSPLGLVYNITIPLLIALGVGLFRWARRETNRPS